MRIAAVAYGKSLLELAPSAGLALECLMQAHHKLKRASALHDASSSLQLMRKRKRETLMDYHRNVD